MSNNYKRGGYGKKKKNFRELNDNYYFQQIERKKINNIDTITKATEEGFTGPTDSWFSDEEFFKGLCGHSDIEGKKDYYFNSYSTFHIHEEMLKDRIRTGIYQDAIRKNPRIFKDKVVLDIGCGTGVLSIFAARAGAKHVYAIDFADIVDYTKEIVRKNGFSDKITIFKSKVEEVTLPVEKVDIIVSEWMGYFLLYESMLDTVLYARDKWLAEDGVILPDKASIYLSAMGDEGYYKSIVNFWDDVYGIKMGCMKPTAIGDPIVEECPKRVINSSTCKILDIDLYTVKKEDLDFSSKYELNFFRNDSFVGLVAWFDCRFTKLDHTFLLSTSPYFRQTHWKQTMFLSDKILHVKKGTILTGSIAVRKANVNFRNLDVKISYHITTEEGKKDWHQLYKIK